MIKIILDPQIFIQKYGGISRYHTEVWKILKNKPDVEICCPMVYSDNFHLAEYNLAPKFSIPQIIKSERINKSLNAANCIKTLGVLATKNFDVFIPTYFYPYFLNHLGKLPFVLNVHDMIFEKYPHFFKDDKRIANKKMLIEKANKIITISENTKIDLLNLYPYIPENKIEVVYLAHSINPKDISLDVPDLPLNYLLFIGRRNNYKNFYFLIKAIHQRIKNDESLFLVCGGGDIFNQEEISLLDSYNIKEKVVQINFKDNQLYHLYKNARAFIFPSEYEGFGIPVLEAMASECPVILTNYSSFPEVAGNAGIYFEKNDENGLLNCVEKVLGNESFRTSIILKGSKQVKKFSWEKTADQCLEIYKSVL